MRLGEVRLGEGVLGFVFGGLGSLRRLERLCWLQGEGESGAHSLLAGERCEPYAFQYGQL